LKFINYTDMTKFTLPADSIVKKGREVNKETTGRGGAHPSALESL